MRDSADTPGFGEVGDEESLAAGTYERARDRLDTAAIAIGLDHRRAFGWHGLTAQLLPIRRDGRQIDRQDATGIRRRVGLRLRRRSGFGRQVRLERGIGHATPV